MKNLGKKNHTKLDIYHFSGHEDHFTLQFNISGIMRNNLVLNLQ